VEQEAYPNVEEDCEAQDKRNQKVVSEYSSDKEIMEQSELMNKKENIKAFLTPLHQIVVEAAEDSEGSLPPSSARLDPRSAKNIKTIKGKRIV
jgi:hypothetical protein